MSSSCFWTTAKQTNKPKCLKHSVLKRADKRISSSFLGNSCKGTKRARMTQRWQKAVFPSSVVSMNGFFVKLQWWWHKYDFCRLRQCECLCLSCWAGSRKLPPHSSGLSPNVASVSWREFSVVVVFSRNYKVKHKREKFSTDGLTSTECVTEENDKQDGES